MVVVWHGEHARGGALASAIQLMVEQRKEGSSAWMMGLCKARQHKDEIVESFQALPISTLSVSSFPIDQNQSVFLA
jgi:hypothetical protein